jgi:hypothetical protein
MEKESFKDYKGRYKDRKIKRDLGIIEIEEGNNSLSFADRLKIFFGFFIIIGSMLSANFIFYLLINVVLVLYGSGFITYKDIFYHFDNREVAYFISIPVLTILLFRFLLRSGDYSFIRALYESLILAFIVFSLPVSALDFRHANKITKKTICYTKLAKVLKIKRGKNAYMYMSFYDTNGEKVKRFVDIKAYMPFKKNVEVKKGDTIIIIHPIYSNNSKFIIVLNLYPNKKIKQLIKQYPIYYNKVLYKNFNVLPSGIKQKDSLFIYQAAIESLNIHFYFNREPYTQ